MKLWSESIAPGARIATRHAFCRPNPKTHVELSDNVSPHLAWSDLPAGTRSLALLWIDVNAPSREVANKEGPLLPPEQPRADFYHLVMVDLPASPGAFAEGELSRGVTGRGKPGPAGPRGTRVGLNDYTAWFEGDAAMEGQYFGYDGPCPPWNDSLVHNYHFRLLALDLARCPVEGAFTGGAVLAAVKGHVLGEATFFGTYALCPQAVDGRAGETS